MHRAPDMEVMGQCRIQEDMEQEVEWGCEDRWMMEKGDDDLDKTGNWCLVGNGKHQNALHQR